MAATEQNGDAPGLAHPTVVPTNADREQRCESCGEPLEEH